MRLFQVGHVVQTRQSVLSLTGHDWFSCKRKERKDFLLRARVVVKTSNMKISRRRWQTTTKKLHKKRDILAARSFSLIQPIKSLIRGVVVDVAVKSQTP